jgi:hypothetical protein
MYISPNGDPVFWWLFLKGFQVPYFVNPFENDINNDCLTELTLTYQNETGELMNQTVISVTILSQDLNVAIYILRCHE